MTRSEHTTGPVANGWAVNDQKKGSRTGMPSFEPASCRVFKHGDDQSLLPGSSTRPTTRPRPSLTLNDNKRRPSRKRLQGYRVQQEPTYLAKGFPSPDWRFQCNQTTTFRPAAD